VRFGDPSLQGVESAVTDDYLRMRSPEPC
jgi:hypothetical protein